MNKITEDKEKLIDLLLLTTNKTTTEISNIVGISRSPINRLLAKLFTKEERIKRRNKMLSISTMGERNPNFGKKQGKKHFNSEGYIMVGKPSWYTGRESSNTVFEHHLVMCEFLGITNIPSECCVHHKDLDKTLMTFSEHTALHRCLQKEISL